LSALLAWVVPIPAGIVDLLRSRFAALLPAVAAMNPRPGARRPVGRQPARPRGPPGRPARLGVGRYAPADYELTAAGAVLPLPQRFRGGAERGVPGPDWADLAALLTAEYPQLFAHPRLRERLDLYHLVYSLEAYRCWVASQAGRRGSPFPSPCHCWQGSQLLLAARRALLWRALVPRLMGVHEPPPTRRPCRGLAAFRA
jgi:hypothetical protein